MKLVVADRLAIYVNTVYGTPLDYSGKTLALATFFFAFQIYCDFAGYSNIAIGAARVMGFKLMTNFNRPYFSHSVSEFWKRWHISLSTWFKDYLYISLGGNRVGIPRWYFNLFIVFTISGLWHGANWTYIIWGALNGFYLVFAIVSQPFRDRFNSLLGINRIPFVFSSLQIIITFILTCIAWVFFRASTVNDAWHIVKSMLTLSGELFVDRSTIAYAIVSLLILGGVELFQEYKHKSFLPFKTNKLISEHLAYGILVILILMLGVFDGSQFIYFQF
jgi:D-alanyl-lipoteichoic acid acyltransferase DltB (MBOAT superfamily)